MELTDYQQEAYNRMMKGSFQGNWCRQAGATVTLVKAVCDAKDDVQWFAPKEMHEKIAIMIMDSALTESVRFCTDVIQWWEHDRLKSKKINHSHIIQLSSHTVRLESNHHWTTWKSKILATDCPGFYNIESEYGSKIIWTIGNGTQQKWHPEPQVVQWWKSVIISRDCVKEDEKRLTKELFEAEYLCKFEGEEE